MIRVYIFTYEADGYEAVACVRGGRRAFPDAVITVADDGYSPVSAEQRKLIIAHGAQYRQTTFKRNGNLRGGDCVRGMLGVMCDGVDDDDVVIKVDSDTVILRGDWAQDLCGSGIALRAAGYRAGVGEQRLMYGNCYGLAGWAVKGVQCFLEGHDIEDLAPEDLTICRAALDVFGRSRVKIEEPWTALNRQGRWAWWNWDSLTADPARYAARYDVVSVGNPLPPAVGRDARWQVMHALCDEVTK